MKYDRSYNFSAGPATMPEAVLEEMAAVEKLIDGKGRALLRQSGTEPVVRVMIESESMESCVAYAERIVGKMIERGHGVE